MESFLSRYKNALALIVVLLAQVVGLAIQARRPVPNAPDGQGVRLIRYWVTSIIAPPERLLHATGAGIRGLWFGYLDLVHVREQNRQLQTEVDRLRLEQAGLAEDAKQGQRLQGLLGFREHYIYKTVPAQVVGASGAEESHIIIIDKGSKDGIQQDMPVITADGIVGKIREVFPHSSHVLEISDLTSGAGVILQATRIRGVLRGSVWGQPQIVNVSPDDRIKPGEAVVTSGGDAIFPRGLPVGTVERSIPDPDGTLVDILIHPAANLARLEEVLVITGMGSEPPAQTRQDIASSEVEKELQKASDILAERLPSRVDPNAPPEKIDDLAGASADGDVARPIRPPAALHADAFTPGGTPPAAQLTPGARAGRVLSGEGLPTPAPARRATPAAAASAASQETAVPKTEGSGTLASDAAASRTDIPKPEEKKPELVHDYSGATPPQYNHPESAAPKSAPANPSTTPSAPANVPQKRTIIVDGPDRPVQQPRKPPATAHPDTATPPSATRPSATPPSANRNNTSGSAPPRRATPPSPGTPQPRAPQQSTPPQGGN
jgi:rod shape-determining protein MreC